MQFIVPGEMGDALDRLSIIDTNSSDTKFAYDGVSPDYGADYGDSALNSPDYGDRITVTVHLIPA